MSSRSATTGRRHTRWLQKAVGAHVDGAIGKETVYKTNAADPIKTILNMAAERMTFYTAIPQWGSFGKGWINRMAGNARYASIDLTGS